MRCYAAFVRQQLRALTLYRFEFFVKILYGLLAMYGARCLWTALYRQNPALLERTLPEMITYAMLAMALDRRFERRRAGGAAGASARVGGGAFRAGTRRVACRAPAHDRAGRLRHESDAF